MTGEGRQMRIAWSERFTVGSGEAAHLFNRLGARTLKMLSVKRGRAGRFDVEV